MGRWGLASLPWQHYSGKFQNPASLLVQLCICNGIRRSIYLYRHNFKVQTILRSLKLTSLHGLRSSRSDPVLLPVGGSAFEGKLFVSSWPLGVVVSCGQKLLPTPRLFVEERSFEWPSVILLGLGFVTPGLPESGCKFAFSGTKMQICTLNHTNLESKIPGLYTIQHQL